MATSNISYKIELLRMFSIRRGPTFHMKRKRIRHMSENSYIDVQKSRRERDQDRGALPTEARPEESPGERPSCSISPFFSTSRCERFYFHGRGKEPSTMVGWSLGCLAGRHFSHEEGFSLDHCRRYSLSSTSRRLPVTGVHGATTYTTMCMSYPGRDRSRHAGSRWRDNVANSYSLVASRTRANDNSSSRSISGKTGPHREKPVLSFPLRPGTRSTRVFAPREKV